MTTAVVAFFASVALVVAGWVVWGTNTTTNRWRRCNAFVLLVIAGAIPAALGEPWSAGPILVLASAVLRFRSLPKGEVKQLFTAENGRDQSRDQDAR
ncbi:hypothetical protein TSST111916_04760 [Tsukamurella strandjordii]|uniref:hypothetical protein n=1 Tax=Tsukamurella TaxID=2060 RepID=UPI001C7E0341|nr:hypothetical protein [Tsukamurella sp. TY48]GIZ97373.1 hypothetical protein TTY48_19850 [Tsukamurella sp. TY48]